VVKALHKLWAEKSQDGVNHIIVAVVLLLVVFTTITLMLSDASTGLWHAGSTIR
jgi:hypothetical protein